MSNIAAIYWGTLQPELDLGLVKHYHFNILNFISNIVMKNVLMAAGLCAALGSAQAGTLSFTLDPQAGSASLASLLPANFTLTGATLTVSVAAVGTETSAPALGSYQLAGETHGGASCPAGGSYVFCESLTQNFVREQVSTQVPMSQSARLEVGSVAVSGNNDHAPLTLINKIAGAHTDDGSTSQGEDVLIGYNNHPDGSVTPVYQYLLTTRNYATLDYTLQYDKQNLSLQLVFDATTLSRLNSFKSFNYALTGSTVWQPASAQLQYDGYATSVPEPSAGVLLLGGLFVLGLLARRRNGA